jgi:hypothetical protein
LEGHRFQTHFWQIFLLLLVAVRAVVTEAAVVVLVGIVNLLLKH